MAVAETSRTYTISLPAETAKRAEELAARDGRSISELVAEALNRLEKRDFSERIRQFSEASLQRNPQYTEEDIPRLIREVRAEEQDKSVAATGQ